MDIRRWATLIGFVIVGLFVVLLGLAGCRPGQAPGPTLTAVPPTTAPTPLPALSLDETSAKEFVIADFGAVHAPVNGDANKYLILGNLPVSKPAADLPPELAIFLGRWEGYSYAPPVKKDRKIVLVVQEITAQGGKAVGWSGTKSPSADRLNRGDFLAMRIKTAATKNQTKSMSARRERGSVLGQ